LNITQLTALIEVYKSHWIQFSDQFCYCPPYSPQPVQLEERH
jgi:hypothetical protein